ncbi:MAG TPA: formate--tetrahydrofolate ligase [Thermotogota bacterium]|nr:formate--tetrahydrofolate ligase [Thermotogota bacterium]HRW34186.1 formate--tetrahydrofolate ligase [Thermotogota bacterium]
MKSDIEIAQSVKMKNIMEIAAQLGIEKEVIPYGHAIGKIPYDLTNRIDNKPGKLVLVTAITPTPAGEGKTTTSIGLSQALNKTGRRSIVTLREPSLGPVFGVKGGAAGGGFSQVLPMEDINLHFTGDIHAVTTAHNLLSAMIDAHINAGNDLKLRPSMIYWPRVMDMNDRALRNIVVGLGGASNGQPREDRFMISVASEVMAILCLSKNFLDLKERFGKIIVARSEDRKFISAKDLGANGAMAALMKNAINPNLVQTLEHTPAIIHGGPFANIAHGTNSIIATKMAMKLTDYTVTEAGFAADLGAEKFLDVVSRLAGFWPDVTVLVATVRALKMHGGVSKKGLDEENLPALKDGLENLKVHLENLQKFGMPVVVALNRFPKDTQKEIELVREYVEKMGARLALSDVWAKGSDGGVDLAEEVVQAAERKADPKYLYEMTEPIQRKIEKVAKEIYRAGKVEYTSEALKHIKLYAKDFNDLPLIVAKTQASLSDDPSKIGAPSGYTLTIRDVSVSAGAGFFVAYAGDIMTMPGLPKRPSAVDIDINDAGEINGLF